MFLQQIERKRSKEYLVTILAVKESSERFSCLGFIFEKTVMLKRRPCRLQTVQTVQTVQTGQTECYFFTCTLIF